jgi:hypothetical protein
MNRSANSPSGETNAGRGTEESMELELSQVNVIEQLLAGSRTPAIVTRSQGTAIGARPIHLPKRLKMSRCRCGVCRTCTEEARWEKVFREKFADPTYYGDRPPRFSSPLAEM